MTRKELVDIFVRSKEVDGKPYTPDRIDPILPFMIGDLMLSEYVAATRGKVLTHNLKKLGSRWMDTYTHFNKGFFSHYPAEVWGDIIDLMDSLNQAMEPDLAELRSRIVLLMENVEPEDQCRIAHLLTAFVLAQYAQICWGQVYKIENRLGAHLTHTNQDLVKLKSIAFKMAVEYFKMLPNGTIGLSNLNTDGIFDTIAEHLREWVNNN